MRLAHLSDTHVADSRRPEDTRRVLEAFVGKAGDAEVDLICHTGDWFDAESSESERALVRDFIVAAAEVAPVVGIRGNHDHAFDGRLFSDLRTKHPVKMYDRPTTAGGSQLFTVGPADRREQFGTICIPWFDKSFLAASLPADVSRDDITRAVNEAAAGLLLGAQMEASRIRAAGAIPILLHHGEVVGWKKSSTGYQPRGLTVAFSAEQLADTGAEAVLLGHIHDGEANVWLDGRIAYAGSTERTDLGETERKGFRLVTFEGGRFVSNDFVELPARRILLLEADWTGVDYQIPTLIAHLPDALNSLPDLPGALVRWRYRIRPQDLHLVDEDAIRRALIDAGAHEVKIEPAVEHEARVRSAEIVTATDTWSKVEAYITAKGITVSEEQRERLRSKLAEIESPAREEVAA